MPQPKARSVVDEPRKRTGLISLDTECCGRDIFHGAGVFFVTVCDLEGEQIFWEWDVDPLTRKVLAPSEDLCEVQNLILWSDGLVLQNAKFDAAALSRTLPDFDWPWGVTQDTLVAGHILASNHPHNLTDMAVEYLGKDILPLERELGRVVKEARNYCRNHLPEWRIAREGDAEMPSAKGTKTTKSEKDSTWKYDMWLPKALHKREKEWRNREDAESVLAEYSNADSAITMELWQAMDAELRRRGLWEIYAEKMKNLPVLVEMERRGFTLSRSRLAVIRDEYVEESAYHAGVCAGIARQRSVATAFGDEPFELSLPKSGNNKSLLTCVFEVLGVPVAKWTESGQPSLDKEVVENLKLTLPNPSEERDFFRSLSAKRKRDKALEALTSYGRFWKDTDDEDTAVLHPSFKPCGTDTTRLSCGDPNLQQCCFDGETEFLTDIGWVRADQLASDRLIAQYWTALGEIDFVSPKIVRTPFSGNMVSIKTEDQIDLLVTPRHRLLVRNRRRKKLKDVFPHKLMGDFQHLHAGRYRGGDQAMSWSQVAWLCAVQADGSYVRNTRGKDQTYGIVIYLTKPRKIERMDSILRDLGCEFTRSITKRGDGQTCYYVGTNEPLTKWTKELMPEKAFRRWVLDLTYESLKMFSDELFFWDGDYTRKDSYSSGDVRNVEWAQIAHTLVGNRCNTTTRCPDKVRYPDSTQYMANISLGRDCSMTTNFVREEVPWNGLVYCAEVPSGYIVVRRNGRVSITGNSKQESQCEGCHGDGCAECGETGEDLHNLRKVFGPGPGREWYSCDAANIELRIPAFDSREPSLMALFERPDEPPYYGSQHLLNMSVVYEDLWRKEIAEVGLDKVGPHCKKKYKSTAYHCSKAGGLAMQYQCGEETADRAFKVPGGYAKLKGFLKSLDVLNRRCVNQAKTFGYVETLIDDEVMQKPLSVARGYPLLCKRGDRGGIVSTTPLNYRTQGTAGWWMVRAMNKCWAKLREWEAEDGFDGYICLTVHDELVFDFPKLGDPVEENERVKKYGPKGMTRKSNLWRIREIQRLMESCGTAIRIPTPVSIEYHENNWSEGVVLC